MAKHFIESGCKCGMKVLYLKENSNVVQGREITVYIYKYTKEYEKEVFNLINLEGKEETIKLNKLMEHNERFWFKFIQKAE